RDEPLRRGTARAPATPHRHADHPPLGDAARRGEPGRLPRLRSGRLHHRHHAGGERWQAGHADSAPGLGGGGRRGRRRSRLMLQIALTAFATFFVTVMPLKGAPFFAALTDGWPRADRRRAAMRAIGVATGVLLVFG